MAQNETRRTLQGAAGPLEYTLERKRVKNINLRILHDGTVRVSANSRVAAARIDAFVISREGFIRAARQRFLAQSKNAPAARRYENGETIWILDRPFTLQMEKGSFSGGRLEEGKLILTLKDPEDPAQREKAFRKYWNEAAKRLFEALMAEAYPPFEARGIARPALKMRDMKTRWGTCHCQKKVITLNTRLLAAPLDCVRYVVLHEYCHLIQPDHSPRFYALVAAQMPDWKTHRAALAKSHACW